MGQFLGLTGGKNLRGKVGFSNFEVTKSSRVLDGSNKGDDLGPSQSRDSGNGVKAIGDISEFKSVCNITREAVDLGDNVSDNAKHGNTTVLHFGGTVKVESLRGDSLGQLQGIEEAGWGLGTDLTRVVRHADSTGGGGLLGRGEGGGGADKKGKDGKLHG